MNDITPAEAQMALEVLANPQAAPKVSLLADPRKLMEAHRTYHSLLNKLDELSKLQENITDADVSDD